MSPELKNYIEKLKAEGDFRPEGVDTWKRAIYRELALSFVPVLFAFPFTQNIYFLVGTYIASYLIMRFLMINYAKPHLPYNEWEYHVGTIINATYFPWFYNLFVRTSNWHIHYKYVVNGKTYKDIERFGTWNQGKPFLGGMLHEDGSEIIIFYDKNNPSSSQILIPITFSHTCLKQSRYDDVMIQYYKSNKNS